MPREPPKPPAAPTPGPRPSAPRRRSAAPPAREARRRGEGGRGRPAPCRPLLCFAAPAAARVGVLVCWCVCAACRSEENGCRRRWERVPPAPVLFFNSNRPPAPALNRPRAPALNLYRVSAPPAPSSGAARRCRPSAPRARERGCAGARPRRTFLSVFCKRQGRRALRARRSPSLRLPPARAGRGGASLTGAPRARPPGGAAGAHSPRAPRPAPAAARGRGAPRRVAFAPPDL